MRAATARPAPRFPPNFDKHSLLKLDKECKDFDAFVTLFES